MVRVLAVADSDSYLKWTAATCAAMPSQWRTEQVVITTPITPSAAQIIAATGTSVPTVSLAQLVRRVLTEPPDVLLLGCTGPVVQAVLLNPLLRRGRRRPVLVTGLPGISVPATGRAVEFRAGCDLFVLHSRRERTDFAALGRWIAPHLTFGLARLPFLPRDHLPAGRVEERQDVVFAAQAKVPPERDQRLQVLLALADIPGGAAVVKLRAAQGEEQTHREAWPYPDLWAELVEQGLVASDALRFSTESMAAALQSARAFVTVSSTAALEAMAAHVPLTVLADFGVSEEMINLVFEGSGCLGTLADVRTGQFREPSSRWRAENYFHREQDCDWLDRLDELLGQRASHGLPPRALRPVGRPWSMARRQLRLLLPTPAWTALSVTRRRLRSGVRALRAPGRTPHGQHPGRQALSASAGPRPAPRAERPAQPPASRQPAAPRDH